MNDYGLVTAIGTVLGVIIAMVTGQWRLSNWLTRQFSDLKKEMYSIKEEVLKKLDYHEEHDDQRFQNLHDDIWTIKLRNAAKDVQMDNLLAKVEKKIGQTIARKEIGDIARETSSEGTS